MTRIQSSSRTTPYDVPQRVRRRPLGLRIAGVAAAAALSTGLAACGDGSMPGMDHGSSGGSSGDAVVSATPSGSPSISLERDEIDVEFATSMIPHHQQAVAMAKMATTQAQNAEVRKLADGIAAAQGPEIATMTSWLKAWGEDVPAVGGGMDHGGMDHGMPGMMTEQEMTVLSKAEGAAFDRMWLQMMIKHHQGAIEMAEGEQDMGKNPQAKELAATIAADQAGEITVMKALLRKLG